MKYHHPKQQQGVALIVTILLLVVITLLAITSARTGSLEERMTTSLRSRTLAFESAEAALGDARQELRGGVPGSVRAALIDQPSEYTLDCGATALSGATTAHNNQRKGLCAEAPVTAAQPGWRTNWANMSVTRGTWARFGGTAATPFPTVGSGTSATAVVAAQPRYMIERINAYTPLESRDPGDDYRKHLKYRVIAQGFGSTATSTAWVQESIQYLLN